MATLFLRNQKIINQLEIADSFIDRGIGLLQHSTLALDQAMWIKPCNNIHTFFMKFNIDCVFLNQELKIVSLFKNVRPYRVIWPQWKAHSVIEFSAGIIDKYEIKLGEQLHVGD